MIRLKTYYPNFYKQQKKRLTIVAVLLIISIVSKITIQSIYSNIDNDLMFLDSIKNNTWLYPVSQVISLLTSIILPLCVMTFQLMQSLSVRKFMAQRISKQRSI